MWYHMKCLAVMNSLTLSYLVAVLPPTSGNWRPIAIEQEVQDLQKSVVTVCPHLVTNLSFSYVQYVT